MVEFLLHVGSFLVEHVQRVYLVKGPPGEQNHLPDVVHVSAPLFHAATLDVKVVRRIGIDTWVEHRMVEKQFL